VSPHWIYPTYERILDHYGPSRFRSDARPDLELHYDPDDACYGWCEWDTIGVNLALCTTPALIVSTLIHEVWHLHQSPSWYTRYCRMGGEHPYEAECDRVAERDLHLFLPTTI
jgi:hypothetical protein